MPTDNVSPASLARRLVTTFTNGNRKDVRKVLRSLPVDVAVATTFYFTQYLSKDDIGFAGRILSDDVDLFESPL